MLTEFRDFIKGMVICDIGQSKLPYKKTLT